LNHIMTSKIKCGSSITGFTLITGVKSGNQKNQIYKANAGHSTSIEDLQQWCESHQQHIFTN
jgi:hypothetical protein